MDAGAEHAMRRMRFVNGDVDAVNEEKSECSAARDRLLARRAAVRAAPLWQRLKKTRQYVSYWQHDKIYLGFPDCPPNDPLADEHCAILNAETVQAVARLMKTSSWKKLTDAAAWRAFSKEYLDAEKLGCF